MTTYKFSMASDGTLVCYKTNNGLFKYSGKSALKLLDHIKNFSFYSFNSVTNKINTNKYTYDLQFISNNHLVTFANIHKFKNKESICIEDEIKSLLDIVKNNTIVLKQETYLDNAKHSLLYKAKAILSVAVVALMLTMEKNNFETQQKLIRKNTYQEIQDNTKGINFTNSNIESKFVNNTEILYAETNVDDNTSTESILNNNNMALSNNIISENIISINDIETESNNNIDIISENTTIDNTTSNDMIEDVEYTGKVLNSYIGTIENGPSGGKETYYDLNMTKVVEKMRDQGFDEDNYPYWIRDDGVKMLGDYVMVAAALDVHPRGSIVATSLGQGLVCDTGEFAKTNKLQLDIATSWSH